MFSGRRLVSVQPEGPPEDPDAPGPVTRSTEVTLGVAEVGRRGNLEWCSCERCRSMETDQSCLCCREYPAAVAQGGEATCFVLHPSFDAVCLNKDVLTVALISHREFRNPATDIYANR